MRLLDFTLELLRDLVRLLVTVADALGTLDLARAHGACVGVPVPPVPATWAAQAHALDQRTAQLPAETDALRVAELLATATHLLQELRTFYLSRREGDSTVEDAGLDFLRLLLPLVFQVHLRRGRSSFLAALLPLLVALDRRLAEAGSEASFHARVAKWISASWDAVTDADGAGGLDRAESVATLAALVMVGAASGLHWWTGKKTPWLLAPPDDWRPVFRLGHDDAAGEWAPAQRRALAYALTAYFPPARGPLLDAAAFQVLDPPPPPWDASGVAITILPVPAQPPRHGGGVGLVVEGEVSRVEESPDGRHRFELELSPGAAALVPVASPYAGGTPPALRARAAYRLRVPRDGRTDPTGVTLHLDELQLETRVDPVAQPATLVLRAALRGLELSAGGLLPFSGRTDLALRYDTRTQQFTFEGGLGLSVRKHLAAGEVEDADDVPTGDALAEAVLLSQLALQQTAQGLQGRVELLADVTLRMGRFATLAVAGTGVRLSVRSAPDGSGRLLGLFDADMQAVSPTGIGLAVDLWKIEGGGMLRVGPDRISGVVELALGDRFHLSGVGQFDHRERWLALVTVERNTPGSPFWPRGVGLLVARGRQADAQAMRSALGSGELDNVLMPRDVVAREARILAALDRFFPPGRAWVFGAMVRFASEDGAFSARIGVLAELPDDPRQGFELHLLATASLKVPSQPRWLLDGVGLWNFGRGEGYLRLALREARLWGFEVQGSAVVFHGDPEADGREGKGTWISVGGFHPAYPAPAQALQGMARLSVNWSQDDNLSLSVAGYLAWTPSCLQFGITADLKASYFGFGFEGVLSFDALVAFDWSCQIDFHASLTFRVLGRTLSEFGVDCTFTASDQYTLTGAAHYEFLCFSGTKHFTCGLGKREAPRIAASEIENALAAELLRAEGWRAPTVAGVVLTERERGVVIPPDGRSWFEQQLVPLDVEIELFGTQRLARPRSFSIVLGEPEPGAVVQLRVGEFAPGLFYELSRKEALRTPTVARHTCGLELQWPLRAGPARDVEEDWEEVVVDPQYVPPGGGRRGLPPRPPVMATADTPVKPVVVRPLAFRVADEPAVPWMQAWARARAAPPPPVLGSLLALRIDPTSTGRPAPLVEGW